MVRIPLPHPAYSHRMSLTPPHRIVLVTTFVIYLRAGHVILLLRRKLRSFANQSNSLSLSTTDEPGRAPNAAGKISVTTVDTVELSGVITNPSAPSTPSTPSTPNTPPPAAKPFPGFANIATYSCHIEAAAPRRPSLPRFKSSNGAMEANRAAWAYCRCAMLFFLALLITWVCSPLPHTHTHNADTK